MWKGKSGSVGGGRQVAGPASQLPEVPECSRVLLIVVFVGHCWPDLLCLQNTVSTGGVLWCSHTLTLPWWGGAEMQKGTGERKLPR